VVIVLQAYFLNLVLFKKKSMKRILPLLIFLFSVAASNAQSYNLSRLSQDDYKKNTIILKVKEHFRTACNESSVNIPSLQKALTTIGGASLIKKFKHEMPPREKYNKEGAAYADLSLIYECTYAGNLPIEKAINTLMMSNVLVYAEPHFIPKSSFTPNDPQATSSGQFHIGRIDAYNAWNVNKGDSTVVIGITDTGTEPTHPDLKGNIKCNYSDPVNGIDDDGDGYLDNFAGWDLGDNDNNTKWPVGVGGGQHGIHVCGTAGAGTDNSVGVAGIGFQCKFLPVKIADNTGALIAAYEGIKYAADHGCKVINCSWGGPAGGQFGQDIITYASINKDALVVVAAGNTGTEADYFPAAYQYAMAVANTTSGDVVNFSSTYGYFVDVSAPGTNINATWQDSSYSQQTGTSMASPIVAGAAAIVRSHYSGYTALQACERLKRTADNNYTITINSLLRKDKIGTGRINLYRALTDPLSPSVIYSDVVVKDGNDSLFTSGDVISFAGLFTNYLAPTSALTATLLSPSQAVPISNVNTLGVINTLASVTNSASPFTYSLTGTFPTNTALTFTLLLKDGSYSASQYIKIFANVDYINIPINDVASTSTSKGRIGYNQDAQVQGLGFAYNSVNLLYDAGLMIGVDTTRVSDCVRGGGSGSDADFKTLLPIQKISSGAKSDFDTYTQFDDAVSTTPIGVTVNQRNYAWSTTPYRKFIIWEYEIKNTSTDTLKNLYAGICADWDIDGSSFANNKSAYDAGNKMGYSWCTNAGGKYTGIKLLTTSGSPVFYAIDNIAGGDGGYDIQGGFTTKLKYQTLSNNRLTAGGTGAGYDILNVLSSGPHQIVPSQSITVAFALIAGDDLTDLQSSAVAAQTKYDSFVGVSEIVLEKNEIVLYPNPANEIVNIYLNNNLANAIRVFDMTGKLIYEMKSSSSLAINTAEWARGVYLIKVSNAKGESNAKFILH
jgi:subtilisin family serine protease